MLTSMVLQLLLSSAFLLNGEGNWALINLVSITRYINRSTLDICIFRHFHFHFYWVVSHFYCLHFITQRRRKIWQVDYTLLHLEKMKLLIVLTLSLAVAMSYTIHITQLSENSLVDYEDNGSPKKVNKENNFDEELQEFNLTSFRSLLIKAKLFERLNDTTTSYTVFAPSNKAITSAPPGLLDNATRLPEVLSYHVHLGSFPTSNIMRDMKLKTLLGGQQKIRFNIYSGVSILGIRQIYGPTLF